MNEPNACPECGNRTVEFRGSGLDMQHRICSQWEKSGHLSWEEIQQKLSAVRRAVRPSGRYG